MSNSMIEEFEDLDIHLNSIVWYSMVYKM